MCGRCKRCVTYRKSKFLVRRRLKIDKDQSRDQCDDQYGYWDNVKSFATSDFFGKFGDHCRNGNAKNDCNQDHCRVTITREKYDTYVDGTIYHSNRKRGK